MACSGISSLIIVDHLAVTKQVILRPTIKFMGLLRGDFASITKGCAERLFATNEKNDPSGYDEWPNFDFMVC